MMLKIKNLWSQLTPRRAILRLLGIFLLLTFALNRGFSYWHIWIGKVPIFVTEFVLASLFLYFIHEWVRKRENPFKEDIIISLAFALLWLSGLISLGELVTSESLTVHNLKRSALCYYSLFGFLTYKIVSDKREIKSLLLWMFNGAGIAIIVDLFWSVASAPAWWPISIGIAVVTYAIYAFLFSLFFWKKREFDVVAFFGGLGFLLVLFSAIRTAFVTLIVIAFLLFLLSIKYDFTRELLRNNGKKVVIVSLLVFPLFLMNFGIPPSIKRLSKSFDSVDRFDKRIDIAHQKKAVPLDKKPPEKKAEITAPLPVKKSVKEQEKEVKVPPKAVPLDKKPPEKKAEITALQPAKKAVVEERNDFLPAQKSVPLIKESSRKETEIKAQQPTKKPVSLKKETKAVPFSLTKFVNKFGEDFFLSEGNALWRLNVWEEAFAQLFQSNLFLGYGVSKPLIVHKLSPYKTKERLDKAIRVLKNDYDFINRITDPKRRPDDGYVATYPLSPLSNEMKSSHSLYWYDMDLHNSHLAILFRFGLFGFAGYAMIIGVLLWRLGKKLRSKDNLAILMFLFLFWQIGSAFFNVVLEGPFMGSIFWICVGLGLSLTRKNKTS